MQTAKTQRPERIIQFGEGGFLRGFADWMVQKMNDSCGFNSNIVVVQPIKDGMCDTLSSQGCVYNHLARGSEGVDATLVNSISRCVKPYDDFEGYIALAENPDFRFIISNTTEAGIVFSPEDKMTDAPAKTFPAKLTQLLYKRYTLGLDGFIFLPCELIDRNGDNLKRCILEYARLWGLDRGFARWIEEENVFTNTLVDRINTGYPRGEELELLKTDAMLNTSEYFHLWVIETDASIGAELPFDKAGLNVIITADKLEMYRTRKVRILNGAHTSLVLHALLSGFDTVRSCVEDEKMYTYIRKCVFDEIIPTLDLPREELIDYAESVIERFRNPYINHYLSSISLNSVSKFKVRVLPSIIEYKKRFGTLPENLTFSLARLIEFYKTATPNDDPEVVKFIKEHTPCEILSEKSLWGMDISFLLDEVMRYVD